MAKTGHVREFGSFNAKGDRPMRKTWIGEAIYGENLAFYFFAFCFWAVAGSIIFFMRCFLSNVIWGPFPINLAELETLQDVNSLWNYHVTITAKSVHKSGMFMSTNGAPSCEYVLVPIGKK